MALGINLARNGLDFYGEADTGLQEEIKGRIGQTGALWEMMRVWRQVGVSQGSCQVDFPLLTKSVAEARVALGLGLWVLSTWWASSSVTGCVSTPSCHEPLQSCAILPPGPLPLHNTVWILPKPLSDAWEKKSWRMDLQDRQAWAFPSFRDERDTEGWGGRQYPVCAYCTTTNSFRHPKIQNFLSTSCLITSHPENEERVECRTAQAEVWTQISKASTLLSFLKLRREVSPCLCSLASPECLAQCWVSRHCIHCAVSGGWVPFSLVLYRTWHAAVKVTKVARQPDSFQGWKAGLPSLFLALVALRAIAQNIRAPELAHLRPSSPLSFHSLVLEFWKSYFRMDLSNSIP